MVNTVASFDKFVDSISLTQTQVNRINSAQGALGGYLVKAYGLNESDVFLQGSFANGTAIKPIDGGEYDVDIICVSADPVESAKAALEGLFDKLSEHGTYRDRLVAKTPCVRVEYADDYSGSFHVDVVPVRVCQGDSTAPLDAPRRDAGWHPTAPGEYTDWCAAQGEQFRRTVKIFKRWRNEHQDVKKAIKSIVLQVLVSENMSALSDDGERIKAILDQLSSVLSPLSSAPVISNPVLADENLAARWDDASFKDFKKELSEACGLAADAIASADAVEAAEKWRELLGESFPLPAKADFGIQLADSSHMQSPAAMGWYEALDSRYRIAVTAREQRGRRGKWSVYPDDGPLLFAGKSLQFQAAVTSPGFYEIWWRVTNTGWHARSVSGLRGGFFKAKDLSGRRSPDEGVNWENTSYTGSHLVEAFLVLGDRVVARSEPMTVNIYNPANRFAL